MTKPDWAPDIRSVGRSLGRRNFMGIAGAAVVGSTVAGRAGNASVGELRLLVDNRLARIARWLRAAGYDAAVPASPPRRPDLMRLAAADARVVVSSDPRLAPLAGDSGAIVAIPDGPLPTVAAALTARLGIDWLHEPFCRCLSCSARVEVVDPDIWGPTVSRLSSVPLDVALPLTRCEACDKLFWQGGHAQRMRARLEAWSAGNFV